MPSIFFVVFGFPLPIAPVLPSEAHSGGFPPCGEVFSSSSVDCDPCSELFLSPTSLRFFSSFFFPWFGGSLRTATLVLLEISFPLS